MPRGDKSKYTDKQERKADHIAEGYEDRGVARPVHQAAFRTAGYGAGRRPTAEGRQDHAHAGVLLQRWPNLQLAVEESEIRWRKRPGLKAIESLPVAASHSFFGQSHRACLKRANSTAQMAAITPTTRKYPYFQCNSGMLTKFMP